MRSLAEETLAVQLEQAGIPFEREYRFAPKEWCRRNGFLTPTGMPKDWRADFVIGLAADWLALPFLIEVEGGSFTGGHRRGLAYELDTEKASAAAILGFRVIRATPAQVADGTCLSWVKQALGLEEKAA